MQEQEPQTFLIGKVFSNTFLEFVLENRRLGKGQVCVLV